jgi:hypothetical protein
VEFEIVITFIKVRQRNFWRGGLVVSHQGVLIYFFISPMAERLKVICVFICRRYTHAVTLTLEKVVVIYMRIDMHQSGRGLN